MLLVLVLLLAVASSAQETLPAKPTLFSPLAVDAAVKVIPPSFPLPAGGTPHSVVSLNEDVMESNATEVLLHLLPDVALTIVWSSDVNAHGRIKKLNRRKRNSTGKLASSSPVVRGGWVKGHGPGVSMVSFVVAGDSYFGVIHFPEQQADGSVVLRTIQVTSIDSTGSLGVAYETFRPDVEHSDPVTPTQPSGHGVALTDPALPAPADAVPAVSTESSLSTTSATSGRKLAATTVTVDVLFLYTPAAATAVGGTTAMVNQINAAIGISNQVYANSAINMKLNLVKAAQVSYTETGFDQSLADLQAGRISGATTILSQTGPDLVQLITTDSMYCGLGYVGGGSAYGYSVVQTQCLTIGTSTHEMGHNFGCLHDYYSDNNINSGWARCDLGAQNNFRTIMSYGCQDGTQTTRVFYHANPSVSVTRGGGSYPTGNAATAFCASLIMKNAPLVAAHRNSTGGGGPPTITICAGGTFCTSPNVCARYGTKDTCCPASSPVWCGGNGTACYAAGYECPSNGGGGSTVTCIGGGTCTTPNVCARSGTKDACCPAASPVWCGGSSCYAPGHPCPGGTETCPGGGTCTAPNVCARSGNEDACCPAASPVWCGGSSCYASGHQCSGSTTNTSTCVGGGTCTAPNVCARYKNTDTCCSSSYPVWCGGSYCYASGHQCSGPPPPPGPPPPGGGTTTCVDGGTCTSPDVCARYDNTDTCCSASYPVWCGGSSCYTPGHQCSGGGDTTTCVNGGTCTSPDICARYGNADACCTTSYPVWCGGSSCYKAGTSCVSGRRFALDTTPSSTPTTPVLDKPQTLPTFPAADAAVADLSMPAVLPTFPAVTAAAALGDVALATPVSWPEAPATPATPALATAGITSQEPILSIPVGAVSG